MPLFLMRPTTENYEINHERKFGSMKYLREKNLGCTKRSRERTLDPQNTLGKKFGTHEIPTRKYLEPAKYPREKIFNPRNTHEGTMARWHQTHETHDGTRPTNFSTLTLKSEDFTKNTKI